MVCITEAREGDVLHPGQVLIAPGNFHMTVEHRGNQHIVKLNQDPKENYCRPSVDVLFRSVAKLFGSNALALVMTGMGQDGMIGSTFIKEAGGHVIAQDEASSVVWGMPGAVVKAGLAHQVVPLNVIDQVLMQCVNRKRAPL